jgi:hypothetical protein
VKSMYEVYLQHRAEGCSPRAATELTAQLYGQTDAEEIRRLQVTLESIEKRDRPPGDGEPSVKVAAGIAALYLQERRNGASHSLARDACVHAYGARGQALDQQLTRPRREFEAELAAVAARPLPTRQEIPA